MFQHFIITEPKNISQIQPPSPRKKKIVDYNHKLFWPGHGVINKCATSNIKDWDGRQILNTRAARFQLSGSKKSIWIWVDPHLSHNIQQGRSPRLSRHLELKESASVFCLCSYHNALQLFTILSPPPRPRKNWISANSARVMLTFICYTQSVTLLNQQYKDRHREPCPFKNKRVPNDEKLVIRLLILWTFVLT